MAYKSITTFIGSEAELDATLPAAMSLARAQDGHLTPAFWGWT
jgi:hypothetical protein